MQRGVKTFDLQPGDVVKKRNARKRTRMGDTLTSEWIGQYRVVSVNNDTNTVKLLDLHRNVELKRSVPYDQLKPYISHVHLSTETPGGDQAGGDEANQEELMPSDANTDPPAHNIDEAMQNNVEEEDIAAGSSTDNETNTSQPPEEEDETVFSQFHDHVPTTSFARYQ